MSDFERLNNECDDINVTSLAKNAGPNTVTLIEAISDVFAHWDQPNPDWEPVDSKLPKLTTSERNWILWALSRAIERGEGITIDHDYYSTRIGPVAAALAYHRINTAPANSPTP